MMMRWPQKKWLRIIYWWSSTHGLMARATGISSTENDNKINVSITILKHKCIHESWPKTGKMCGTGKAERNHRKEKCIQTEMEHKGIRWTASNGWIAYILISVRLMGSEGTTVALRLATSNWAECIVFRWKMGFVQSFRLCVQRLRPQTQTHL